MGCGVPEILASLRRYSGSRVCPLARSPAQPTEAGVGRAIPIQVRQQLH